MKVWRIVRKHHAASAFSGEGARLVSGRWNSIGVPMVYTSTSLSLALVEVFVHVDATEAPNDLVSIAAEIDLNPGTMEQGQKAILSKLPNDWRRTGHRELQRIGDTWARSSASLAMPVPSAVVDGEWNVLLNPQHPEAATISVEPPRPFSFDARMFKRRR